MDQVLANSYAISEQYPPDLAAKHDVWFREHYEVRFMRRLVRFYAQRGKPVALVGHSWGGNAVANEIARKVPVSIEFMATLDPVSRKGPPPRRLENVRRWINVYVDYATATWLDLPNCVARVGGPWGRTPAADENVACSSDVKHADALVMFRKYAEKALRERMG